jgi:hypothetical protein
MTLPHGTALVVVDVQTGVDEPSWARAAEVLAGLRADVRVGADGD